MKTPIKLFSAFFGTLLLVASASAADIYVNVTSGDDGNTGTSISPYKTLTKAMSEWVNNDAIYIDGGDYSADSLAIRHNLTFHLKGNVKLGVLRMRETNVVLTLKGDATGALDISKKLILDSGYIVANNSDAKLRLLESSTQYGGSRKSYIRGGYHYQYINNPFDQDTFHVGSVNNYRRAEMVSMTRTSGNVEDFYVEYIQTAGTNVNATLPAATRNISLVGHWFVSKSA